MRSTIGRSLSMVIIAVAMLAPPASAQRGSVPRRSTTVDKKATPIDDGRTGFELGVYTVGAMGLTVGGDGGSMQTNFGPGAGASVGYGFNRTFSAFASFDLSKQGASGGEVEGSFGLKHLELGVRANLPYGSPANIPYVTGSFGRRTLAARVYDDMEEGEHELSFSGTVFGLGAGIQHVLSPTMTIDGGAVLGFGRFSRVQIDDMSDTIDSNGSNGIRLRFGMIWRPGARRST